MHRENKNSFINTAERKHTKKTEGMKKSFKLEQENS